MNANVFDLLPSDQDVSNPSEMASQTQSLMDHSGSSSVRVNIEGASTSLASQLQSGIVVATGVSIEGEEEDPSQWTSKPTKPVRVPKPYVAPPPKEHHQHRNTKHAKQLKPMRVPINAPGFKLVMDMDPKKIKATGHIKVTASDASFGDTLITVDPRFFLSNQNTGVELVPKVAKEGAVLTLKLSHTGTTEDFEHVHIALNIYCPESVQQSLHKAFTFSAELLGNVSFTVDFPNKSFIPAHPAQPAPTTPAAEETPKPRLTFFRGGLNVTTENGAIRVKGVDCTPSAPVSLKTTNGSVEINGVEASALNLAMGQNWEELKLVLIPGPETEQQHHVEYTVFSNVRVKGDIKVETGKSGIRLENVSAGSLDVLSENNVKALYVNAADGVKLVSSGGIVETVETAAGKGKVVILQKEAEEVAATDA
ncbi:hypothetical protein BCR33DRAFT_717500 [Rhizoclosmatium globosum]|uniref:Adhesin domain-containing protein n=1 Tax=Rhizoclosmatium globosum TaxID=329046 RepID=A0A1Y2CAE0_9FUNG|nr:hypothetical protein BCR33DRAFT_717500 [Rhizoclosmatium globosum]|eukprot:ORY43867.1 hypothetical protein BCR33DRAFT_717500 [Rhizoclosmatium globosum]